MSNPARFLSRWSRLKRQAVPEAPLVPAAPGCAADEIVAPIPPGTDLTALLREELSDAVRKQTLKAIFADPHFNVMDGLDTYIDDYSISEPISPAMMATLNQARFLFAADEAPPGEIAAENAEAAALDSEPAADCDNLRRSGQQRATSSLVAATEKEN